MSKFNTANIENTSGGAPTFSQGLNVEGTDITTLVTMTEYYTGASEPSSPANGAVWYDGTVTRQYVNSGWYVLTLSPPPVPFGDRGVVSAGANSSSLYNIIEYVAIPTTSNSSDFGDMTVARQLSATASSGSVGRGVFAGGSTNTSRNPSSNASDVIDYITYASLGNGTDFGDLSVARLFLAGCSDALRGVFGGGYATANSNVMDYITIATTGNAIDFGDLSESKKQVGACGNQTYGVFAGGRGTADVNTMEYITIQTTANSQDFGDLTRAKICVGGAANKTRGLYFGGATTATSNPYDDIDYITIDTPGNASDFGALSGYSRYQTAAFANATRAVSAGGSYSTGNNTSATTVIRYVVIDTLSNSIDFGDLILAQRGVSGLSGD